MNRKGVAYTLISVLLLLIVASLFFSQTTRDSYEAHAAVANRVLSVDSFIKNLEHDSQRAAYIAGFRTMIAMEQHMTSSGTYLVDPDATFKEIFLTGNLSGKEFIIMNGSNFEQYLDRVQEESAEQGILFNASIVDIQLWQAEPWNILVNFTLDLNITDARGSASWKTQKTFTGEVPVTDLRDPLFSIGTFSRVQRVIKKTNVTGFVNDVGDANDTTGLVEHYNGSMYIAAGRGPSILMRFKGDFSDSEFGFESLVDTKEIVAQGLIPNSSNTVVDYKYFTTGLADACNIQNLPIELKLSNDDLAIYEIDGKLTYGSC